MTFPRSHRLTTRAELQHVRTKGKRIRTEYFEVRALASPSRHPRVGFIVPKYTHSAVARNRLKRRLREIVRLRWLSALEPVDVVIRTRAAAYAASFGDLERELAALADRLGNRGRAS